jgi:hypothetical protein
MPRIATSFSLSVLLLLTTAGCFMPVVRPSAGLVPKPYLVDFPGISGDTAADRVFLQSLKIGGFDGDVELIDWPRGASPLTALHSAAVTRTRSVDTARSLALFHQVHPDRPILLISESGGAGPMVWTLEALPPDMQVEAAVFIAPAMSPTYDLSTALHHVRAKAIVFSSSRDTIVLGTGTTTFGTIDGPHTPAAGLGGFVRPPSGDPMQYAKLDARPYDPAWFWTYGHAGGHTDALGIRFASGYLAPILTALARAAEDRRGAVDQPREPGHDTAPLALNTEIKGKTTAQMTLN